MKEHRTLLRLAAGALLALSLAGCQSSLRPYDAGLDQAARTVMDRYRVPGLALAHIEQGRVVRLAYYGQAGSGEAVTEDTLFNVASLTKPLFATGYLHRAEASAVDLDAPLAEHWVDPDVADDPRLPALTARLALSHQSGFPNWRGSDGLHFMFEPGARHEYSGEGFEYVRRALERQTGQAMPELMRDTVLQPAGMDDTHFGWQPQLSDRLALGYDEAGQPIDDGDLSHRQSNAAANTFTTLKDYARFTAWVARGADLEPAVFTDMTRLQSAHPDPLEFWGLGWRLTRLDNRTLIEHDGREAGVRTLVLIDPVRERGLVMLTNSSNGELIVRDLLKASWPDAEAILSQRDRDIWHYLSALPEPALPGLLGFIAQSPSFSMKLLYAAKAGLIDPAGLSAAELAEADSAIEAVLQRQFEGELQARQLLGVFRQLGQSTDAGFAFAETLNADQARQWIAALQQLS